MKNLIYTKWHYVLTIITIGIFTIFSSCNKDDDTFRDNNLDNLNDALDQSFAAELFDEIIELGDEALNVTTSQLKSTEMNGNGYGNGHRFMRMGECVTITKVITVESVITTIDFGVVGCTGNDDRLRQGKIIISKIGNYWEGESTTTYAFEDYFVNGNQLTGTKSVTGYINDDGNRQMDIVDNGTVILAEGAGTITRTSQRTREVIEGSDTRNKHDDIIKVTGSCTGINRYGETFSSEIVSALIRNNTEGCSRFYIQGIVNIVKGDGTEITIDYGDGTCDNLAEITTNGETKVVELMPHRRHKN